MDGHVFSREGSCCAEFESQSCDECGLSLGETASSHAAESALEAERLAAAMKHWAHVTLSLQICDIEQCRRARHDYGLCTA
jgi:hypothetical protein